MIGVKRGQSKVGPWVEWPWGGGGIHGALRFAPGAVCGRVQSKTFDKHLKASGLVKRATRSVSRAETLSIEEVGYYPIEQ